MVGRARRAFWGVVGTVATGVLGASCSSGSGGAAATGDAGPGPSVGDAGASTWKATVHLDFPGASGAQVIVSGKVVGTGSDVPVSASVPAGADRLVIARVPGSPAVWMTMISSVKGLATPGPGGATINAKSTAATLIQASPYLLTNIGDTNAVIASVVWNTPQVDSLASWLQANPDASRKDNAAYAAAYDQAFEAALANVDSHKNDLAVSPQSFRFDTSFGVVSATVGSEFAFLDTNWQVGKTDATLGFAAYGPAGWLNEATHGTIPFDFTLYSLDSVVMVAEVDRHAFTPPANPIDLNQDYHWPIKSGTAQYAYQSSENVVDLMNPVDTVVNTIDSASASLSISFPQSDPTISTARRGLYVVRFVNGAFGWNSATEEQFISAEPSTNPSLTAAAQAARYGNFAKIALKLMDVVGDDSATGCVETGLPQALPEVLGSTSLALSEDQTQQLVKTALESTLTLAESCAVDATFWGRLEDEFGAAWDEALGPVGASVPAIATASQLGFPPLSTQLLLVAPNAAGKSFLDLWSTCDVDTDCFANMLCCNFPRCTDNGTPNTCLVIQCGDNICSPGEATSCPQDCTCSAANAAANACEAGTPPPDAGVDATTHDASPDARPVDATVDAHDAKVDTGTPHDATVDTPDTSTPDATPDATIPDAKADASPSPDATTVDGGEGIPGSSCAAGGSGMTNCGPGGSGTDSCCASLQVTGGTYYRTYTNSGAGPASEADPATVSNFRLDKYLVTVGRFRQFVEAWNNGAGWLPAAGSGKHAHLNGGLGLSNSGAAGTYETGWVATDDSEIAPTDANLLCQSPYNTWTSSAGTQESLPINCVNWWESYAFCIWDGGFLPSEAEWEYAAAGGSQQREYPWGSVDPGTANLYAIYGGYYTGNPTYIAPVGTANLGAGLWGQFDMAGEVFEWNVDWYASYTSTCTDCAYLSASSYRVFRGGVFYYDTSYLLPPNRGSDNPSNRDLGIGFRCARTP